MAAISYNTLCYGIIYLWQTSVSLKDERIKIMLIRTQDKKGIVNLNNMESLWISEVDSVFDITIAFSDGAYVIGQ